MAERRGDSENAEAWARRAYEQWVVHASTVLENHPEPAIRFHLAQILLSRGEKSGAEALLRSLCTPHTWMGFYTGRASLELAQLLEADGRTEEAARRYQATARLWEAGDEAVVGEWRVEAEEGLARTSG